MSYDAPGVINLRFAGYRSCSTDTTRPNDLKMTRRARHVLTAAIVVTLCVACDMPYGAYGTLRSSSGEPISGATVVLQLPSGDVLQECVSGRDGAYSVEGTSWTRMPTTGLTITKAGFTAYSVLVPSSRHALRLDIVLVAE
jgi:hypothetical protein